MLVAMEIRVVGVLSHGEAAQRILQLAIHMGVVGLKGNSVGVRHAFRIRVEPGDDLVVCVPPLEAEAFLHFNLNARFTYWWAFWNSCAAWATPAILPPKPRKPGA